MIVSDDVGCQPDLVEDGVEGCVFPVGDVEALTDALRRVLATPETAEAMGQRGLAKIQTWDFEEDVVGLRRAIAQVTRKIKASMRTQLRFEDRRRSADILKIGGQ